MNKVSRVFRLGAAIAAFAVPCGATAATVEADLSANQSYTSAFDLNPGGTQQYKFTVLEDLRIAAFSVAGTGTGGGIDLSGVTFGLMDPPEDSFDTVQTSGTAAAALDFVPGATFSAGDLFSFYFADGIDQVVGLTFSFETESVAPVPVPAAGVLLLSALAGGTAFARRKKRQG